ncbi:MAG: hypothetical protein GY820_06250 [Gammaproteobacteria bacterium]|nr:hypothetical protein [Gammaproteobacteria bacterium]
MQKRVLHRNGEIFEQRGYRNPNKRLVVIMSHETWPTICIIFINIGFLSDEKQGLVPGPAIFLNSIENAKFEN